MTVWWSSPHPAAPRACRSGMGKATVVTTVSALLRADSSLVWRRGCAIYWWDCRVP